MGVRLFIPPAAAIASIAIAGAALAQAVTGDCSGNGNSPCRIIPPSLRSSAASTWSADGFARCSASARNGQVASTSSASSRSSSSAFRFLRFSISSFSLRSSGGGAGASTRSRSGRYETRCQKKALLGALFASDHMTCGNIGWTFPGLIWGDCPITACIMRVRQPTFGGPME